jgi:predicted HTH transcriptional regulator
VLADKSQLLGEAMDTWDQAALQALVDVKEEERQDLEFKAADALAKSDGKKTEITVDVSAMANAAGGTMIFGLAEDDHHAAAIDPIDPGEYPKEWLDQVIHGIEPRIPHVNIEPVSITGQREGVVYVMNIPQSVTAHQARDDRYYRRYNFERLRMRHHEIVLNRAKIPNLELEIGYETKNKGSRHDYMLTLKVANHAMVTAAHYKVEVSFPHPFFEARADSIHADWPVHTLAIRGLLGRRETPDSVTII